jgi:phospholipase/carboxylesterase
MIPIARAKESRDLLLRQGYAPEWHEYPMEHSVCPQELADIAAWLRRVLT